MEAVYVKKIDHVLIIEKLELEFLSEFYYFSPHMFGKVQELDFLSEFDLFSPHMLGKMQGTTKAKVEVIILIITCYPLRTKSFKS